MRSLFRSTFVPALALALAAVSTAGPAGSQEFRRPYQNGEGTRGGQRGPGAPGAQGPRGGAPQRGFGAPHGPGQAPLQAQQQRRGGNGAGIAAGVIGGLAAGAILGGILSNGGAAAAPGPGVDPRVDPGCPLVRRPVYDEGGRFAGYQTVPSC